MAPERIAHVRVKARVRRALNRSVRAAGAQCEALGDGVTVEIGDHTDYEPDALVNCGPRLGDDDTAAPNPVVVVEVLSPSTRSVNTGGKLAGYFQVPSIRHYLIVAPDRPSVIHRWHGGGGIETRILTAGTILLDPPGLSVAVEEFYTDRPPPAVQNMQAKPCGRCYLLRMIPLGTRIVQLSALAIPAVFLAAAALPGPALGQTPRPAARAPAAAAPPAAPPAAPAPGLAPASAAPAAPAAVPAVPQQTTAVFADWTLRCTRLPGAAAGTSGAQACEAVQGVQREDRPIAQVAIGRPAKGQPLQVTVLVPPSVSLGNPAALSTGRDGDPVLDLSWRRCLPGGCLADAALNDDAVRRLRGWAEPGRIAYADGGGRSVALPFSPRGLAQALDALAREDAD